jgi:hypothetical protein
MVNKQIIENAGFNVCCSAITGEEATMRRIKKHAFSGLS